MITDTIRTAKEDWRLCIFSAYLGVGAYRQSQSSNNQPAPTKIEVGVSVC